MASQSKYYYTKYHNSIYSSVQRQPQIVKWNKDFYVSVNENLDHIQDIDVTICKFKGDPFPKPKKTSHETVKPIIEELFLEYYYQGLRYLSEATFDDGEFYIIQNSKNWYQVNYYSEEEKNSRQIVVDFRDSIEDLWLIVHNRNGRSGRLSARKNGDPITFEKFKQYLNLVLKFLSDPNSYYIYMEMFIINFKNLADGNKIVKTFEVSYERSFSNILDQLELRNKVLERYLIEDDELSTNDRIKLRGELSGVVYAIKTINLHK